MFAMIAIMMNDDAAVSLRAHSSGKIGAYVENTSGASGSMKPSNRNYCTAIDAYFSFSIEYTPFHC